MLHTLWYPLRNRDESVTFPRTQHAWRRTLLRSLENINVSTELSEADTMVFMYSKIYENFVDLL